VELTTLGGDPTVRCLKGLSAVAMAGKTGQVAIVEAFIASSKANGGKFDEERRPTIAPAPDPTPDARSSSSPSPSPTLTNSRPIRPKSPHVSTHAAPLPTTSQAVVDLLIAAGFDPNAPDVQMVTPLHRAAEARYI
jgi:hypothetical protein